MKMNKKNIIAQYLKLLDVKFTDTFLQRISELHPFRDTLFGISDILSEYRVKSSGVRVKEKQDIKEITPPFIADMNNGYLLVTKIIDDKIYYLEQGQEVMESIDTFIHTWKGTAVISEVGDDSKEPNYEEHKKHEKFKLLRNKGIVVLFILLFSIGIYLNQIYSNVESLFLILTNLIGVYIGYLLLQKQLHVPNSYADKICSLVRSGGCNNVLNSSAAKFLGLIGWSEIGLGYFITNLLIILFIPSLIPSVVLINCCALPYSLWSVWYQRFRAKEWCPLCLIVQVLLWLLFTVSLIFGSFKSVASISVLELVVSGSIFFISISSINALLPYLTDRKMLNNIQQKYNSLRIDETLFRARLMKQNCHETNREFSSIIWGNEKAKNLITIITNPHCGPCAVMHKRIKELIDKIGDKVCVQYIFSSFSEELESSEKFLIAVYLSNNIGEEDKERIFDEWFEYGKFQREDFFRKHNLNLEDQLVLTEYEKHKLWNKNNQISGTPTILINGYEMPQEYTIEDFRYFVDLEI